MGICDNYNDDQVNMKYNVGEQWIESAEIGWDVSISRNGRKMRFKNTDEQHTIGCVEVESTSNTRALYFFSDEATYHHITTPIRIYLTGDAITEENV